VTPNRIWFIQSNGQTASAAQAKIYYRLSQGIAQTDATSAANTLRERLFRII
jgi:hypothetical protein